MQGGELQGNYNQQIITNNIYSKDISLALVYPLLHVWVCDFL